MNLSLAIPLFVGGAILALLVAFAVLVLRDPEVWKRRVEAPFRRAPKPAKAPGQDHYYRPYWS